MFTAVNVEVTNLINFVNINSHNCYFKNGKFLALKNIAKKCWQILWKTVIFGNIYQIWHHLATLHCKPIQI